MFLRRTANQPVIHEDTICFLIIDTKFVGYPTRFHFTIFAFGVPHYASKQAVNDVFRLSQPAVKPKGSVWSRPTLSVMIDNPTLACIILFHDR